MKTDIWDKLEQSLKGLRKDCPDGFTTHEFGRAMGWGSQTARIRLRELIEAGKVRFAGDRPTKRMDGRNTTAPVYALSGKK